MALRKRKGSNAMAGKIVIITIITGVTSPWIVGQKMSFQKEAKRQFNDIGIEYVN